MRREGYAVQNERVFEVISDRIISGAIQPGEQISEKALARDMGCSIVPVREAMAQLIAWGVLEKRPHRGTFARRLSPEVMMAHADFRLIIYTYAVGRAATEGDVARVAELESALGVYEDHLRLGLEGDLVNAPDAEWFEYINAAIRTLLQAYGAIVRAARLEPQAAIFQQEDLIFILSTRHFWGLLPRQSMLEYIEQSFLDRPLSCFLPAVKAGDPSEAQRLHQEQYRAMSRDIVSRIAATGVEFFVPRWRTVADIRFAFNSIGS